MKIYSKIQINGVSIIMSIIVYLLIMEYVPQLYRVGKSYMYFKSQPNIVKEYED